MVDISEADFRGVAGLLLLLSDPEAVKEKIDELKALTSAAVKANDEVRRTREEAQKLHSEGTARLMDGRKALEAVAAKEAEFAKKERALAERQAEFNTMLAETTTLLAKRKELADTKDKELLTREQGIVSRESRLEELMTENERRKEELDKKMTAMRNTLKAMG